MTNKVFPYIAAFFTNRLLMLFVAICVMFYILTVELFSLQIIEGERHLEQLSTNIAREVNLTAQRGNIYDRLGRPLAVNQFSYSVKIDPSVLLTDAELNAIILDFVNVLRENDEDYLDILPIAVNESAFGYTFEFNFHGDNPLNSQVRWIAREMELPHGRMPRDEREQAALYTTAEQAFMMLRERWGIDESVSKQDARDIIAIRAMIWPVRFRSYQHVEVARDVGFETVTRIKEEPERFRSLDVRKASSRYYPMGRYLAHIVGHVDRINDEELSAMQHLGYTHTDFVGRTGIELAFESNLRGTDGSLSVVVTPFGRRVAEIEESRIEPRQGDDIFLSIDAELQRQTYHLIEEILTEIIIGRMTSTDPRVENISARDVLASLVAANNLSPREIFESEHGSASFHVYAFVRTTNPYASVNYNENRLEVNRIIAQGIEDGDLALSTILLVLVEQGIIEVSPYYAERIRTGAITPMQVIIDMMNERQITPAMTNIDPSTASAVIVDVNTGGILAAVSYPSFCPNEFMNNTNVVFPRLMNDPTRPMINRPFTEERAPGSTFKMASAIAALEGGIINQHSLIYCPGRFTRAGRPYSHCWNRHGCGYSNVIQGIGASCNYFFFDAFFRLGNAQQHTTLHSIGTLNHYMSLLSFDEPTGVEIGEANRARGRSPLNMATPELKYYHFAGDLRENPEWLDGNTTHAVIGQGFNNYTPAVMARYTAIIATRGERVEFSLLNRIVTENEVLVRTPVRSSVGSEISSHTWDLIHAGMRDTITGSRGTGRTIFADFPISVAGKTGTAEHQIPGQPDHTAFSAFVPFENPEIAIYVMMPFSDARVMPSPAAVLSKRIIAAYYQLDYTAYATRTTNTLIMR